MECKQTGEISLFMHARGDFYISDLITPQIKHDGDE